MFPNEVMMKQQTWNDILGAMIAVRDAHGWREDDEEDDTEIFEAVKLTTKPLQPTSKKSAKAGRPAAKKIAKKAKKTVRKSASKSARAKAATKSKPRKAKAARKAPAKSKKIKKTGKRKK
jgi:hypothetical protein